MTDPCHTHSSSMVGQAKWLSLYLLILLVLLADHGWSYPTVSRNISVPVYPRSIDVHTEAHETSGLSKAPPPIESPLLSRLNTANTSMPLPPPAVAPPTPTSGGPRIDGKPLHRVSGFELKKSGEDAKGKRTDWDWERAPIELPPGGIRALLGTATGGFTIPSAMTMDPGSPNPIATDRLGYKHFSKQKMRNSGIVAADNDHVLSNRLFEQAAPPAKEESRPKEVLPEEMSATLATEEEEMEEQVEEVEEEEVRRHEAKKISRPKEEVSPFRKPSQYTTLGSRSAMVQAMDIPGLTSRWYEDLAHHSGSSKSGSDSRHAEASGSRQTKASASRQSKASASRQSKVSGSRHAEASTSRQPRASNPRSSPANVPRVSPKNASFQSQTSASRGSMSQAYRSKAPLYWSASMSGSLVAQPSVSANDVESRASFETGSQRAKVGLSVLCRGQPPRRDAPQREQQAEQQREQQAEQQREQQAAQQREERRLSSQMGRSSPIDIKGPSRQGSTSPTKEPSKAVVPAPSRHLEAARSSRAQSTVYTMPMKRQKNTAPVTFVFRVLENAFIYLPDSLFPAVDEVVDASRVMRALYIYLIEEVVRANLLLLYAPMVAFKQEVLANPKFYFAQGDFALFFEQQLYHFVTRAPPTMAPQHTLPLLQRTSSFTESNRESMAPRMVRLPDASWHRFDNDTMVPTTTSTSAGLTKEMMSHLAAANGLPSDSVATLKTSFDEVLVQHRQREGRPVQRTIKMLTLPTTLSDAERHCRIFAFAHHQRQSAGPLIQQASIRAFHYSALVLPLLRPLLRVPKAPAFFDSALIRPMDPAVRALYTAAPVAEQRPPGAPRWEPLSRAVDLARSVPALSFYASPPPSPPSPPPAKSSRSKRVRFDPSQDTLKAVTVEPKRGASKAYGGVTQEQVHRMPMIETPPRPPPPHWSDYMTQPAWFNKTAEARNADLMSRLVPSAKREDRKRRWSSGRILFEMERDPQSMKAKSAHYANLLHMGNSAEDGESSMFGFGRAIFTRGDKVSRPKATAGQASSSGSSPSVEDGSEHYTRFVHQEDMLPKPEESDPSPPTPPLPQRANTLPNQEQNGETLTFDDVPFDEKTEEEALKEKGVFSRWYTRYVPRKVRRFISAISPFHINANRHERAYERTRDARRPRREARNLAEKMRYNRLQRFRNWLAKLFGKPSWQEDPSDAGRHYHSPNVNRVFAEKSK